MNHTITLDNKQSAIMGLIMLGAELRGMEKKGASASDIVKTASARARSAEKFIATPHEVYIVLRNTESVEIVGVYFDKDKAAAVAKQLANDMGNAERVKGQTRWVCKSIDDNSWPGSISVEKHMIG